MEKNLASDFDAYRNMYGEGFITVLKHLVATRELFFDSKIDGSYFVRGLSVETGLQTECSFALREASAFSQILEDGHLKAFRSANKGNTFDLTDKAKVQAKKYLASD